MVRNSVLSLHNRQKFHIDFILWLNLVAKTQLQCLGGGQWKLGIFPKPMCMHLGVTWKGQLIFFFFLLRIVFIVKLPV